VSQRSLEEFWVCRKARTRFDLVLANMKLVQRDSPCFKLVSQQVASADSICANIEEGYGRLTRAEYVRFPDFAHGSTRETRGRYLRMSQWFEEDVIRQRIALADKILGIPASAIERLRTRPIPQQARTVQEEVADDDS
jgi:four helix bundle protein